jgi:ubiquinone/menaquinone biosynthesis C-methylase UbiE
VNHLEVGRYWNENARTWTPLARAGYDIYRDHLNTPAFFDMLPPVQGLQGLDIGCGEGHNTRRLAQQGADVVGLDIAGVFVWHAHQHEAETPLGLRYHQASAVELPFATAAFDFATAFMSLMDIPELERVVAEVYRVLKPGGFFQFSITHPCFDTPHRRQLRDESGQVYAIEVGGYFEPAQGEIMEWLFSGTPPNLRVGATKFKVPRFGRTLSQWLNLLLAAGFQLEQIQEPRPSDAVIAEYPLLQDAQVVAYFLHIRVRKPLNP